MKKIILFLFITLIVTSCRVQGLTNDLGKLNEDEKMKIIELSSFDNLDNKFIYKINGLQLNEELKKHPKSIVYIFKNGCTSKQCYPLFTYENYAKNNGYKLFLVMDGYADLYETLEQPFTSILFSINNEYYNSKYRITYSRYFENEITNKPREEKRKDYLGNIYFFKFNNLEKIVNDLPKN
jgi:hypothetical protein